MKELKAHIDQSEGVLSIFIVFLPLSVALVSLNQ